MRLDDSFPLLRRAQKCRVRGFLSPSRRVHACQHQFPLARRTTVLPDDLAVQIPRTAKCELVPLPLWPRAGAGLVSDSAAFPGRLFALRSYRSAYSLVRGLLIVNVNERVDVSRVRGFPEVGRAEIRRGWALEVADFVKKARRRAQSQANSSPPLTGKKSGNYHPHRRLRLPKPLSDIDF